MIMVMGRRVSSIKPEQGVEVVCGGSFSTSGGHSALSLKAKLHLILTRCNHISSYVIELQKAI